MIETSDHLADAVSTLVSSLLRCLRIGLPGSHRQKSSGPLDDIDPLTAGFDQPLSHFFFLRGQHPQRIFDLLAHFYSPLSLFFMDLRNVLWVGNESLAALHNTFRCSSHVARACLYSGANCFSF